jgi:hypothetical protein
MSRKEELMPSQEEFDELKGRIVELENQLKARVTVPQADPSPDEVQAFLKVKQLLGPSFHHFCWPPCYPVECQCGPCGPCVMSGGGFGGVGRFGGLGG